MTPRWRATQHTSDSLFGPAHTGSGSRRRDYELLVHPSRIKALRTGEAVVLTPGVGLPTVARIYPPGGAHQPQGTRLARVAGVLQRLRARIPNPRRKQ